MGYAPSTSVVYTDWAEKIHSCFHICGLQSNQWLKYIVL